MDKGHILIVDDEENILSSLEGILTDEGFSILKAKDGAEALKMIKSGNPDLVLLDIWIPGLDGIQTLKAIKKIRADLNVIMMSGHGTIETAVRATKLGAFDFIEKPLSLESVISTVRSALEHAKSVQETPAVSNIETEEIIGNSSAILDVKRLLKTASVCSKNILIQGERGTGKEFIARAIHLQCPRRDMPFIKINCSALKEDEAEDILFGVKSSSKQGGQKGRIEQAEGGTLFLDDIEGLSIKLQNKLIKIIRDKKFKRKGDRRFIPLDAGIIASSNQALADEVKKGKFKEGLLNLLKEITINLPSLKDRIEDMSELVGYFIKYFNVEYGKRIEKIDDDAVEILKNFDWHGNAKELKNVVEHIIMTVQGNTITSKDVSAVLPGIHVKGRSALFDGYSSMEEAEKAWETEFITHHLKKYNWDIAKTAVSLNTDRTNLLGRLKRLEIPISSPFINEGKTGFVLQKTLKRSVVLCGQGLHSGLKTGLILSPLPPNKGIIFGDISSGETVPANLDYVQSTDYATTLKSGMTSVKTVEHIMAVLHMYGITNLLIKIGDEVPIMDGSAADFCQLIEDGGIEEQDEVVEELIIVSKYTIGDIPEHGQEQVSSGRYIYIEPSERFSVHYSLDYPSPIGRLEYAFTANGKEFFKNEIAPARTFAFIKDYEKLEEMGLGSGGKLSNVILVDDEKVINTPLRFDDEFVRHKILDIIGDFYLLGRPIRGRITAMMTGHTENIALLKKI
ncbi:MAG: UDP-3-O-[3-hydroxymyristoyl] N-acetylglucosamine deacetylase, partial [Nitrospinae bacterium]|nr:UDP-3-O-[3-hydroxymyristoyl] N-acetylglucosamine deacetylase [Nitrospinota bacterium]